MSDAVAANDPLDNTYQETEGDWSEKSDLDLGYAALTQDAEHENNLPQAAEIILPVFMKRGRDRVQIGDAVVDPDEAKFVVHLNTPAGRDINGLIGTGVLAGFTFGGMMSANELTNKLN